MKEQEIQDYLAQYYPKRYSGNGYLYHKSIIDEMMSEAKDGVGYRILDVGCGIGFVPSLYRGWVIIGIDTSEKMLRRNPYECIRASVYEIPFKDKYFDFIICRSLLHHLENPILGLKEMHRVLKIGGKIAFWETNFSIFNDTIRRIARYTNRFSHWHKNFKSDKLLSMVLTFFHITNVQYKGYLAYPLLGFPDVIDLPLSYNLANKLICIDNFISRIPIVRSLGWGIMIKGSKKYFL